MAGAAGGQFGFLLPTRAWRRPSCATSLRFLQKEDSCEKEVANAWALTQSKISKLKLTLRKGATDPLMETLTAWCRREMDRLLHGQLTVDATTWSARGRALQERIDWLHGMCQRPRMPESGSLDKLLNEEAATAQLS